MATQSSEMMGSAANSGIDRFLPGDPARSPAAGYPPNLLDISVIRGVIWRQRYPFAAVVFLALVTGLVVTMLMTPFYQSSATFRVNMTGGQIVEGQEIDPFVGSHEYQRYSQTIADVFESRSLARRVVEKLDANEVSSLVGDEMATGPQQGQSEDVWEAERAKVAASVVRGTISVDAPIGTRLMTVTSEWVDPDLAARIANSYVDAYIEEDMAQGMEANTYAVAFLDEQIADIRQRLGDAERRAIEYARSNRVIGSPSGAAEGAQDQEGVAVSAPNITVATLTAFNQRYTDARAERLAAEQRWRSVQGIPAQSIPAVQSDTAIQALQSELGDVSRELANLRVRYRDDYPQVQELIAQEGELEEQISRRAERIKAGIRSEYELSRAEEQALANELQTASDETLDEQDRRVQFNLLDREVGALRNQLAILLNRYNEISVASNIRRNSVAKVDEAEPPVAPSSPNLMRNLLLAFLAGLGLAGGLALLREILSDQLRSADDVERRLGISVIGQTPQADDDMQEQLENRFSPLSEAYASIATSLAFAMRNFSHPVIQITSSQGSEGKTTSAITLANHFASLGRKVLLIDMDLRRPGVAQQLGMKAPPGSIVDVLQQNRAMSDFLLETEEPNLDILPVGTHPSNPVEVLSSGIVADFLDSVRSQYDLVIVDSSPVLGIADAPLLSRVVDGVVFVIEANRSHLSETRTSLRRLGESGAVIIGAILTKFRSLDAGQRYGYHYQYYKYDPQEE